MHELLLFGHVPAARHSQVLNILAGFTATQPQRVIERHLIYRPAVRKSEQTDSELGWKQILNVAKLGKKGNQRVPDLFCLELVQNLEARDLAPDSESTNAATTSKPWALVFHDVPEAGKPDVISRSSTSTDIAEGDVEIYMKANGYGYMSEYVIDGQQFVYNNVVLLLHKSLISTKPPGSSPLKQSPTFDNLKNLDDNGSYILRAMIHVQDNSKTEVFSRGLVELLALKNDMRGAIDLKAPDRLSMDTRVQYLGS